MNASIVLLSIIFYSIFLYLFSHIVSKKSSHVGLLGTTQNTKWWVVAISLVGTTISGVTFISVPGMVATPNAMTYFQFVIGNCIGFLIIGFVLMPLYYRVEIDSIYEFLGTRFGKKTHQSAAYLFILSRLIGSAFRLYLGCLVLYVLAFKFLGIPFEILAIAVSLFIWFYTRKGGLTTIIWTDLFQTLILIFSAVLTFIMLIQLMPEGAWSKLADSQQFRIFVFDDFWNNKNHFLKQIISGAVVTVAMSGLDQDMMQKNLKFKTVKEAQKNYLSFIIAFLLTNIFFLLLGLLFYEFMVYQQITIPLKTDTIYALLASDYLGWIGLALFVVGVVAATLSSCASSFLALATSFVVDIKSIRQKQDLQKFRKAMKQSHTVAGILFIVIMLLFHWLNEESVVVAVFKVAGYTYGPLLGLFAISFIRRLHIKDNLTPYISILSISVTIFLDKCSTTLFFGYQFGFEILLVNSFFAFFCFWASSWFCKK